MVGLSLFMKYCKIEEADYDSVLMQSLHQNKLEDKIRDYIIYLKVVKQLSSNSVNLYMAAIAHFYSMNNVVLHWRRLSKFKGKKRMKVEDKPYSKEIMHNLSEYVYKNNFKVEEHRIHSLLPKSMNSRVTKLLERAELSNPRNKLKKLLQDLDNLEKWSFLTRRLKLLILSLAEKL
jgi:hypothetical protein